LQLLEDSVEEQMEKALSESDKIEAENKDADAEDNKARSSSIVILTSFVL
jgi:transcription initiation factor TFIID subunit 5